MGCIEATKQYSSWKCLFFKANTVCVGDLGYHLDLSNFLPLRIPFLSHPKHSLNFIWPWLIWWKGSPFPIFTGASSFHQPHSLSVPAIKTQFQGLHVLHTESTKDFLTSMFLIINYLIWSSVINNYFYTINPLWLTKMYSVSPKFHAAHRN